MNRNKDFEKLAEELHVSPKRLGAAVAAAAGDRLLVTLQRVFGGGAPHPKATSGSWGPKRR
jgi:hypothetical protein